MITKAKKKLGLGQYKMRVHEKMGEDGVPETHVDFMPKNAKRRGYLTIGICLHPKPCAKCGVKK